MPENTGKFLLDSISIVLENIKKAIARIEEFLNEIKE